MKKQLSLICLFAAIVFTSFANKTIYVAPLAAGTGTGVDAANPCAIQTALGALDATGYTTIILPASANFLLSGGMNGYGRIPIADNSKVIIEGNNSVFEGNGGETRIIRASTGCNIELRNLTFKSGNAAASLGGAIFFAGDSLKISGCIFENNTADNGGAIGSRGKYIKITNSWFKNNVLRSSFQGAAISHTGTTAGGKLFIENTTFSNNMAKAANVGYGIAIITAFDGNVRNYLSEISISNCTFYQNKSGLNTHAGDAAIQFDNLGTTAPATNATNIRLINNTFFGNTNAAINVKGKQQAVTLINNVIVGDTYANSSVSTVQDHGFITELSVAEGRPAVVAKNNYIVAKVPLGAKLDDNDFKSGNTSANTLVVTSSQNDIDLLGLSTTLQAGSAVGPYLSIVNSQSPLIEGGINAVDGVVMFPTDIAGVARATGKAGSKYDIGAYEYNNIIPTAVRPISKDVYTITQSSGEVSISNINNKTIAVSVYLPSGQSVYNKTTNSSLSVEKTLLPKGILIFFVDDGVQTVVKKVIL